VIAVRPLRTSYSRSRRRLDGLAGSWWPVFRDEGISGTRGRDKRPGLDDLLKGVARREFDVVAAWSVCRLGRSLSDLFGLLGELRAPRFNPGPTCDLSEGCP
jgi:DNA invertase Pin-like site-specific DNA recombinase